MKVAYVIGILIIAVLIIWFEWPQLQPKCKKERIALLIFTAMACVLGILLVFYPDMPGPTQAVDRLYKPLGEMIKK